MPHPIVFELCAETLAACLAARDGGADRIELSDALNIGGLTPARSLVVEAVRQSGLPIHVLVRPRSGSFYYDVAAIASMRAEIEFARCAGASGVVIGALRANREVDVELTRALVDLARPLQVTFHRAFDETPDLEQALEDVITAGCQRILTSGGAHDVVAGATTIATLVVSAGSRITIAAGGGLRLCNARHVAQQTGARHFHGSLPPEYGAPSFLTERVRAMKTLLCEE